MRNRYDNIQELIKERSFVELNSKGGIDSFDNFIGDHREGWVQGLSRSRDSGLMPESNFSALLESLGGEKKGKVEVCRFGHWACGWVESIQVHTSAKKELKILMDSLNALEDYPLLDESDYYEREAEEIEDTININMNQFIRTLCEWMGLEADDFYDDEDMQLLASELHRGACAYFGSEEAYGPSPSMFNYRMPDCTGLKHTLKDNPYWHYLSVCFGYSDD